MLATPESMVPKNKYQPYDQENEWSLLKKKYQSWEEKYNKWLLKPNINANNYQINYS